MGQHRIPGRCPIFFAVEPAVYQVNKAEYIPWLRGSNFQILKCESSGVYSKGYPYVGRGTIPDYNIIPIIPEFINYTDVEMKQVLTLIELKSKAY